MENNTLSIHKCQPEKQFFTQICSMEDIGVSKCLPDIEQIVSAVVDPEVLSVKIVNTMKGTSYEGQHLTGKKAVIEIKLKQKILYVAEDSIQSVHVIENEVYQSAYIVIPCLIEGADPALLLKKNMLRINIKVEDVFIKKVDEHKVFKNVSLLITLSLIKTYEICYSEYNNCTCANIYAMYNDGSQCTQLTSDSKQKNIKPLWSPSGRHIAFLSIRGEFCTLKVHSLGLCSTRQITQPGTFKSISSFCWTSDSGKIIAASHKEDGKELYSIDVNTSFIKQLTHGNGIIKSYRPKCSPDGCHIAFIRSVSGLSDLWIMNSDGLGCKKITSCGRIKYFDWSMDGRKIVYISGKGGAPDEICLLDLECMESEHIHYCDRVMRKRKIQYSPDNMHIAFIGSEIDNEDIYICSLEEEHIENITRNDCNTKISDFTWNADSSCIYYSANELFHYNVYSISLPGKHKYQLTGTTASDMELCYRPTIS